MILRLDIFKLFPTLYWGRGVYEVFRRGIQGYVQTMFSTTRWIKLLGQEYEIGKGSTERLLICNTRRQIL